MTNSSASPQDSTAMHPSLVRCITLAVAVGSIVAITATGRTQEHPPHIVVFISDDLGRAETSVYGNDEVRTPNMMKLAARGMTFNNAFVASPSCCPNRYSLLTGLMPARHGAHPNHSQPTPSVTYLLPILHKLGYHVASFGKIAHGRNKYAGCDFHSSATRNLFHNVTAYFAKHPVRGPTCLLVGDRRPHVAWSKQSTYDPATVTLPKWFIDTPETRAHWTRYLTDISAMDEEMGQILAFAQETLGDNVIYLFTSDHGGQWPRGKWNLYDSGIRVPLIVAWPGQIAAGVRTDAMVSWVDILPTLIELAGAKVPSNLDGKSFADVLRGFGSDLRDVIFTTHTGDGKMNIFPIRSVRTPRFKFIHNLRPDAYFTNHSDRLRKDGAGAYWDSWDAAAEKDPRAAKIIRDYYTRPEFELYNLDRDALELHNLAADPAHGQTLSDMRRQLQQWTRMQNDALVPHAEPYPISRPLPVVNPKSR